MGQAGNCAGEHGGASFDVAIIGAGPAGLTAAYLLTKAGLSVAVIEQDAHHVGGISRTVEHDGYRFDIGGHRFFSKSQQVVDLWNEILPADFITRPRMSRIYYEGKFYAYPLRAFEALWNLGVVRSTLCMASFAKAQLFPRKQVKSFEDWTTNQFGFKLYSIFFKTYTEKVWGMPCDAMSADWAAQRIKGLSLWSAVVDGLKRSLGLNQRPNDGMQTKSLLETFRYPRLGPGMMWEAARDRIVAGGNQVLMGHALKQLTADGAGGWRLTATHAGGERLIQARQVISSAPLRDLAPRIHPLPRTMPEAMALKYRDFLTVALKIRSDKLFPDNWIYIHDSQVKVGRIQNFRSWSPEMVPDAAVACVGLEYFCFEGDGLWSMADADLVELAKREMVILGLVAAAQVLGGVVVRQDKAYPVYDETYATNVAAIRSELEAQFPTLHLVGRNGMHRYNNQDHAMMTAMLTVENIIAGARVYDVWCVNEDAEYHEAGVEGGGSRPSEDQATALASVRDVPGPVLPGKVRPARRGVNIILGRFAMPHPSRAMDSVFLRYIAASGVALAVDLTGFSLLLRLSVPPIPASAASYLLGIIVHWLGSSRMVFGNAVAASGPRRVRQKALFVAAALVGLALTVATVGSTAAIGIDPRVGKLVAVLASFITTWIIRRKLVFK